MSSFSLPEQSYGTIAVFCCSSRSILAEAQVIAFVYCNSACDVCSGVCVCDVCSGVSVMCVVV